MDEDPRYLQGIALFNEQFLFDAHDAWEDLWADTRGPDRLFYQSLIHAAVTLYHWRNGNKKGARHLYAAFLEKSAGYSDSLHGLDFGKLKKDLEEVMAGIEDRPWDASKCPKLHTEGLEIPPAHPVEEM